jgi:hypothetical protein
MGLFTVAEMQAQTDHLGAVFDLMSAVNDPKVNLPAVAGGSGTPVAGTVLNIVNNMLTGISNSGDANVQLDFLNNIITAMTKSTIEGFLVSVFNTPLTDLTNHCSQRGRTVAATIVDLASFLSYYNGGAGGLKFSSMVTNAFGEFWFANSNIRLPYPVVMSEAINPKTDAADSPNGMGTKTVAGVFTAGTAVDSTKFAEVDGIAAVIADFVGGTAPPTVTVAGVDDTGVATTTWSATLTGNTPLSAVSTTIVPGIVAQARQTVTFASVTGIAIGSWLTINGGLPDQEVVLVENIAVLNVTAVFQKAYNSGATVTGVNSTALTPSVSGRKIRSVTGITIGVTGQTAGTIRVEGIVPRVGI